MFVIGALAIYVLLICVVDDLDFRFQGWPVLTSVYHAKVVITATVTAPQPST